MKRIITLLIIISFFGCKDRQREQSSKEFYSNNIEVVKVRNCEYVLWHNSYGSDMEHYAGCSNNEH